MIKIEGERLRKFINTTKDFLNNQQYVYLFVETIFNSNCIKSFLFSNDSKLLLFEEYINIEFIKTGIKSNTKYIIKIDKIKNLINKSTLIFDSADKKPDYVLNEKTVLNYKKHQIPFYGNIGKVYSFNKTYSHKLEYSLLTKDLDEKYKERYISGYVCNIQDINKMKETTKFKFKNSVLKTILLKGQKKVYINEHFDDSNMSVREIKLDFMELTNINETERSFQAFIMINFNTIFSKIHTKSVKNLYIHGLSYISKNSTAYYETLIKYNNVNIVSVCNTNKRFSHDIENDRYGTNTYEKTMEFKQTPIYEIPYGKFKEYCNSILKVINNFKFETIIKMTFNGGTLNTTIYCKNKNKFRGILGAKFNIIYKNHNIKLAYIKYIPKDLKNINQPSYSFIIDKSFLNYVSILDIDEDKMIDISSYVNTCHSSTEDKYIYKKYSIAYICVSEKKSSNVFRSKCEFLFCIELDKNTF